MAPIDTWLARYGANPLQHPPACPCIFSLLLCVAYPTPEQEAKRGACRPAFPLSRKLAVKRKASNRPTKVFAIDTNTQLMPLARVGSYQFTLHECGGAETPIEVDRVLVGIGDIRSAAVDIARQIMAREIGEGRLCLTCWIVVTNEYGHNIMTLHFGDAIQLMDHDTFAPINE